MLFKRVILAALVAATTAALTFAAPPAQSAPALTTAGADRLPGAIAAPAITPRMITAAALRTYLIQPGDTLFGIAAQLCGRGSAFPSLAAGNRIPNPNLIYAGATLRITCTARPTRTSAPTVSRSAPRPSSPPVSTSDAKARAVVAYVLAQVGKAYVWDAAGPNAFDCSGLVVAAYARVGVWLPHNSEALLGYGRVISRSQLRLGDMVMPFHGHVFIYVGGNRIVEAADPAQGVRLNTLYAFLTARRFV